MLLIFELNTPLRKKFYDFIFLIYGLEFDIVKVQCYDLWMLKFDACITCSKL